MVNHNLQVGGTFKKEIVKPPVIQKIAYSEPLIAIRTHTIFYPRGHKGDEKHNDFISVLTSPLQRCTNSAANKSFTQQCHCLEISLQIEDIERYIM